MLFPRVQSILYKKVAKPILFLFDPEFDHNLMTKLGEFLENQQWLIGRLFRYENKSLTRTVLGVKFENPIGLAAGFDYDGHLTQVVKYVGFGFNTVGTVTACAYEGNPGLRLGRLPRSKSLLVNKGFKSEGADAVRRRLDQKNLSCHTVGISVGSTNLPSVDTIDKAIKDYIYTFQVFQNCTYIKYFELNISCPNIKFKEAFYEPDNFDWLCQAVASLKLSQPIFVKMPNEISFSNSDQLVDIALKHDIKGFIFSNLVKNRDNPAFDNKEMTQVKNIAGNFSGTPTFTNSNKLIKHTRKKFGNKVAIIGCGGVFSAEDARTKLSAGADLVQLITGIVFEGPQLIGQINQKLDED